MTPGPADDRAARPPGRGHLRTSRADREQVVDVLKAAYVQERLTKDEFDVRVGQALASRTYADLTALTADLPADLPAEPTATAAPPRPVPARPRNPAVKRGVRVIAATTAFTASASTAAWLFAPGSEAAGMLLWALMFIWFGIVLTVTSVLLEAQLKPDLGGQLPPAPGRPGLSRPTA